MAYVPQEVPVKKEITAQTVKVSASSVTGVIQPSVTPMTKFAVPNVLLMALMQYAAERMRMAPTTDLIPLVAISIISRMLKAR